MAQQRPGGLDMSKFSTSTKILVGAALVGIINALALPWQHVSVGSVCVPGTNICSGGSFSFTALSGQASWAGLLMFIMLIALLAWEVMQALGTLRNTNLPMPAKQITLILVGGVLLFGVLKFLLALSHLFIGAILGLLVLIAIGYAGWMQYQEPAAAGPAPGGPPPPPPASGGGGFSA